MDRRTPVISLTPLIDVVFILTASFESILVCAGFTLGVNTFFTVLGIFVLRLRRPELHRPYRTPLYPIPPLVYLGFTGWTLGYILLERPEEGLRGLAIIGSGALAYLASAKFGRRPLGTTT